MQDVGAGWLMTSLSSSPAMVALVEAADSIPVMLLAMPAGALADIIDRRRLLIGVQSYLMLVAGALAIVTLLELTTPWVLLGFIFALGVGAAMVMPAWAAIVPDLVRPDELQSAVALNSIAINVSRAIGPAIAGLSGRGRRPVACVPAERALLYRHHRGARAVAARASQEHAARRAVPERDPDRRALRHAHARAAGRAHPRRGLLRLRKRHVVALSADRAPRAAARAGDLRAAPHVHRHRRRRRRHAAAAASREVFARCAGRGRQRALRARGARARARAERARFLPSRCSRPASHGSRSFPRCRFPRR